MSRYAEELALAVLAAVPRHTRKTVAVKLGLSMCHMHHLCNRLLGGRRLLSDWDVEILHARHQKPGRVPNLRNTKRLMRDLRRNYDEMLEGGLK